MKCGFRRRSVDELDLGPPVDLLRQRLRVPVGEVDAAVRLGLADALRVRSAVDAVAVAETDPRAADRIHTGGNDPPERHHAFLFSIGQQRQDLKSAWRSAWKWRNLP
jgi:hypothetical protein